jgi:periplasmic protein TonB
MRKVYTPPPVTGGRFWPIAGAVGLSFVLFLLLPFTTMISGNRAEKVELTKVGAVEAPPPDNQPPPEPPPPPEKEEEPPPPELAPAEAQPMSIDQLTADVAVGGGGFLAGMLMSNTENPQEAMKEMIFSMEDLDQKPVAIAQISPLHPRDLLKAKVEGQVVLLFVVDEQGRVEDPRVENSSRPEFEKPALDAVRKWKFKPGTKEGTPVKTYIRQPIRFSIATS